MSYSCFSRLTQLYVAFTLGRYFFAPPGHIATLFPVQALYPETRTRPYEIRIYYHHSFALSVELQVGSGLQDPQQLLVRPA